MTTPYICGICRGSLRRQARTSQKLQWDARASFISLNTPQPERKGATTQNRGEELTNVSRSPGHDQSTKDSTSRRLQWPIARNATDEILESLFLAPRSQTSTGRYKPRYSASKARDGEGVGDEGASVSNSSSTATMRLPSDVSKVIEEKYSFRRLDMARKPRISTLKRLSAHHDKLVYKPQ